MENFKNPPMMVSLWLFKKLSGSQTLEQEFGKGFPTFKLYKETLRWTRKNLI